MKKDSSDYHILVIEDNLGDFMLVQDYLEELIARPQVDHCQSFKEAKSLLASTSKQYDVVLLDLSLPDKSGEDLITETVKLARKNPLIVLTGYTDASFALKSLSLGVSDYLLKDELNATTLFKSITYNIERHKNLKRIQLTEQRYTELFQLSPQPMYIFDEDSLKFLQVNEATIRTYGYSREEFLKMDILHIRNPEEKGRILDTLKKSSSNGHKGEFMGIYEHLKKDGTPITVEIHSNLIEFEGKKARLIIANDITLKIRYLNAIEQQNAKLREIAWIQSHVVRAPLARMMGLIDLIKSNKDNASENGEFLDYVIASAQEVDKIIREISEKSSEIDAGL
ncbi:response regulator [Arthrospiribacter ruber]|uniref:PAS domain S-box protein n=1 Tax=Arthrospiribacter ruber TaxID=2487934 RepID=A0A951IZV8_9BACT|nr:PAS domain S-box protein [Arthrospiribacter ruber]MBW3468653.1 PAS domain S-box protein [Arthrospiribacter ruber]